MEDTTNTATQAVEDNGGVAINDPQAVLKALNKANTEAKTYRENLETVKSQLETAKTRITELENGENPYKALAIKAQVRLALNEQGVKDQDRILRFLDLNGIDLDEQGNLVGLDDKLDTLKTDLPELFDVKRKVANKADAFTGGDAKVTKSLTEQQVDQLLGF